MRGHLLTGERGSVVPLVAVMLLGLVVLVGLVVDAGLMFAARRDLQGIADGAVRAGAMALDEDILRDGAAADVRLDAERARSEASDYLDAVGFLGSFDIEPSVDRVVITLELHRKTLVMGMVGIREVTVRASSTARPRYGIDSPEGAP